MVLEYKPTFIPLAIRTIRTLSKLDMPYLYWHPQFLTGSAKVEQEDIDFLIDKGASVVWNVYGSTEFPPPIFLGESTASFNIPRFCKFADDGELYMGSTPTGDVFDLKTKTFSHRKKEEIGVTWKS